MGFIIGIKHDHGVIEIVGCDGFPESHTFRFWRISARSIWRTSLPIVVEVKDHIESSLICLLDSWIEQAKKLILVLRENPIRKGETNGIHMPILAHLLKYIAVELSGKVILHVLDIFPGVHVR